LGPVSSSCLRESFELGGSIVNTSSRGRLAVFEEHGDSSLASLGDLKGEKTCVRSVGLLSISPRPNNPFSLNLEMLIESSDDDFEGTYRGVKEGTLSILPVTVSAILPCCALICSTP
jgi:hypothetical protein